MINRCLKSLFLKNSFIKRELHVAAASCQKKNDDRARNENQRDKCQLKNHFKINASKKTCDKIHISPIPEFSKKQGKSIFPKNQCLSYPVACHALLRIREK